MNAAIPEQRRELLLAKLARLRLQPSLESNQGDTPKPGRLLQLAFGDGPPVNNTSLQQLQSPKALQKNKKRARPRSAGPGRLAQYVAADGETPVNPTQLRV